MKRDAPKDKNDYEFAEKDSKRQSLFFCNVPDCQEKKTLSKMTAHERMHARTNNKQVGPNAIKKAPTKAKERRSRVTI